MKRVDALPDAIERRASPPGNGGRGLKLVGRVAMVLTTMGIASRKRGAWIETRLISFPYDPTKPTACVLMTTTKLGRRVFGFIFVISGFVHTLEDGRYSLLASNAEIKHRVISDDQGVIRAEDLIQAFEAVEKIYDDNFEVITMFDKKSGKPTT